MSFYNKIMTITESILNEIDRIEMHANPSEGGPDYDTIIDLTDLIEGSLKDIRELIKGILEEAEGKEDNYFGFVYDDGFLASWKLTPVETKG